MDGLRKRINTDNLILVILRKNGISYIEVFILALCRNKVIKSLYTLSSAARIRSISSSEKQMGRIVPKIK